MQVRELAAAGITVISGGGNSGPGWGTLMNPADDPAVVGVGGLDESGALGTPDSEPAPSTGRAAPRRPRTRAHPSGRVPSLCAQRRGLRAA